MLCLFLWRENNVDISQREEEAEETKLTARWPRGQGWPASFPEGAGESPYCLAGRQVLACTAPSTKSAKP